MNLLYVWNIRVIFSTLYINKILNIKTASQITTIVAIPVATPFAMADLISADFIEILSQLGGN